MLKSLFFFYIVLFSPFLLLIYFVKTGYINSTFFAISMLTYAIVYHPFISGLRLIQIGKIQKKNFFKNFIPFWRTKYFFSLFFGYETKKS